MERFWGVQLVMELTAWTEKDKMSIFPIVPLKWEMIRLGLEIPREMSRDIREFATLWTQYIS